jgi:hypothetical protein
MMFEARSATFTGRRGRCCSEADPRSAAARRSRARVGRGPSARVACRRQLLVAHCSTRCPPLRVLMAGDSESWRSQMKPHCRGERLVDGVEADAGQRGARRRQREERGDQQGQRDAAQVGHGGLLGGRASRSRQREPESAIESRACSRGYSCPSVRRPAPRSDHQDPTVLLHAKSLLWRAPRHPRTARPAPRGRGSRTRPLAAFRAPLEYALRVSSMANVDLSSPPGYSRRRHFARRQAGVASSRRLVCKGARRSRWPARFSNRTTSPARPGPSGWSSPRRRAERTGGSST